MPYKAVLFAIILTELDVILSSQIKLLEEAENEFEGKQGFVTFSGNGGVISLISGSNWSYTDAVVVCRQLGKLYNTNACKV